MNCTNKNHHVSNEEACVSHEQQNQHKHQGEKRDNHSNTHYHINKMAVKGWFLNCVYLSLHAVEIYLIIKLV
jgi:hypothetical protein